ncbi:hypothetical protein FRC02_002844 [Tulasnella sp. 418]|nr:hypothetical protein FRC02_002844 [Tulasnella sp. 418]
MVAVELDLRPGQGLGMFELGLSLWTVLESLQQHKNLYPQVDVKFDTLSPTTSPIILHVRPHIDLLFSPKEQRLVLICLRKLRGGGGGGGLIVRYKEKTISSTPGLINGNGVVLRRGGVNNVFGPTYAGETMKFPGVWFAFDEDHSNETVGVANAGAEDRNQEVKRIIITQRGSGLGMDEPLDAVLSKGKEKNLLDDIVHSPAMNGEVKRVVVNLHEGITIHFHVPPSASTSVPPVTVRLGISTAEDLICDLGTPTRVHYKEDDRMAIHDSGRNASSSTHSELDFENEESDGYFYNYLQYGIDFLISGYSHVVQKIILHTNVPGTHLFQRYKRCPWEIADTHADSRVDVIGPTTSDPAIAVGDLLEVPELPIPKSSGGKKKGKKGGAQPQPIPTKDEVGELDFEIGGSNPRDPDARSPPLPDLPNDSERRVTFMDKIDAIKASLGQPGQAATPALSISPGSNTLLVSSKSKQGPRSVSSTNSQGSTPLRGTPSSSLPRQAMLGAAGLSTSPPTMVLDRLADLSQGAEGLVTLPGSTTQLMGFDGVVLEISGLGDVLSVMMF